MRASLPVAPAVAALAGAVLAGAVLAGVGSPPAVSAAGPPSLRYADWAEAEVPGSACGAVGTIELKHGSATVSAGRWPSTPRVAVAAGSVVYGELAPGVGAAALQVRCSNLGGTAAGQLAFAVVVYAGGAPPHPLGVLTPQAPSARDVHVPILAPVSVSAGRVTVRQYTYGVHDPDCCPSGLATTVWAYRGGSFRPVSTAVERRAAG